MFKGLCNRLLGDFVENHSLVARIIATYRLAQVPGDGLSLAIKVSGQVDGICICRELLQLVYHFFLTGQDLVISLPAMLGIYPHAADQLLP